MAGQAAGNEFGAAEPRYLAVWVDGSQAAADEVLDWGRSDAQPSFAGRLLFDPENPVRTLADTTLARPAVPDRYVEFRGGDRLPGRIVKYVGTDEESGVPAHLMVELDGDLGRANVFVRSRLRVLPDWIRRIVQRPPAGAGVPAKGIRFVGGASASFEELHWRSDGVQVLTDAGVKSYTFADITLLDSGEWKPWEAWHRQLAVLSPGLESRLMRIDLADGARLTTSFERLKPRSLGGDNPDKWFHLLQPAWSLDLLAAAHRRIRVRTCFAPHEAPLTAVEPSASRHQAVFSQAWGTMRLDENVRGDPLRAAGREFMWGFGVHAYHELEFELPTSVRRFHTKLGLDPWAGPGGCARGRVRLDEQTIFESPLLIGAGPALDCGSLAVRPGPARLILVADADAGERPAGADPFDIRDIFNWLEPIVELAPEELRREIEPHYLTAHPQLAGWRFGPADSGNWRLVNRFDDTDRDNPGYHQVLLIAAPVTLTRQVAVDPKRRSAVLRFGRPGGSPAQSRFEISIDGRRLLREPLPGADRSAESLRTVVPLHANGGQSVEFSVRLDPAGQSAFVDWRGMTLVRDSERK